MATKIKWTKNQYGDWSAEYGNDRYTIQKSGNNWIVEKNGKFCSPPGFMNYGFRYLADAKKMVVNLTKKTDNESHNL